MTFIIKKFALGILFVSLMAVLANSFAAENIENYNSKSILKILDTTEKELKRRNIRLSVFEKLTIKLPDIRKWALDCVSTSEQRKSNIEESLDSLGERVVGEPPSVALKRSSLTSENSALEKSLATCRLILLRSEESIQKISEVERATTKELLFAKGSTIFVLLKDNLQNPYLWINATKIFILENSGLDQLGLLNLIGFIIAMGLMVIFAIYGKLTLKHWMQKNANQEKYFDRILNSVAITLNKFLVAIVVSVSAALYLMATTIGIEPVPFVSIVIYGLPIIFFLMAGIHLFLHSFIELEVISIINSASARALNRRLNVLLVLIFIGYLLFYTILAQSLPEPALLLAQGIYGTVLVLNLIWIVFIIGRTVKVERSFLVRFILSAFFIGALLVEWMGYRNLSTYIVRVEVGTSALSR